MRRFPIIEEWRLIPSYPSYEASNFGRIRRAIPGKGTYVGRIVSQFGNGRGYMYVNLFEGGELSHPAVAKLVLEAFVGLRPLGYEVNHKDGDKSNDFIWNLEWITKSGNLKHMYALGLKKPIFGINHKMAKYSEDQMWEVKRLIYYGLRIYQISKRTNVHPGTVASVKKYGGWKHLVRTPV